MGRVRSTVLKVMPTPWGCSEHSLKNPSAPHDRSKVKSHRRFLARTDESLKTRYAARRQKHWLRGDYALCDYPVRDTYTIPALLPSPIGLSFAFSSTHVTKMKSCKISLALLLCYMTSVLAMTLPVSLQAMFTNISSPETTTKSKWASTIPTISPSFLLLGSRKISRFTSRQ